MNTIGYFSLISAMVVSVYAVAMSIYGKLANKKAIIASAERAAVSVGGFLVKLTVIMFPSILKNPATILFRFSKS
ncbi:hypothetical protein LCGC14_3031430, partial [marine sediment metagenome]